MSSNAKTRLLLALALVAFAAVMRILPHPWNFTPVGAVALFSGACFDRKRWAFAVPLTAMLITDAVTNSLFHSMMFVVYATFAAIVAMGLLLRNRRSVPAVGAGAVAGATLFYAVTNFAMWTISTIYPRTLAGLIACYVAGIPFYGNMLAGDLIYSAILFGVFAYAAPPLRSLSHT